MCGISDGFIKHNMKRTCKNFNEESVLFCCPHVFPGSDDITVENGPFEFLPFERYTENRQQQIPYESTIRKPVRMILKRLSCSLLRQTLLGIQECMNGCNLTET